MAKNNPIRIHATWHGDDEVWVATSPDMRGFVVEAGSMEDLHRILAVTVPDYLSEISSDKRRKNCDFEVMQRQAMAC